MRVAAPHFKATASTLFGSVILDQNQHICAMSHFLHSHRTQKTFLVRMRNFLDILLSLSKNCIERMRGQNCNFIAVYYTNLMQFLGGPEIDERMQLQKYGTSILQYFCISSWQNVYNSQVFHLWPYHSKLVNAFT